MNIYADKTAKGKQSLARQPAQSHSTFQLKDNRPQSVVQKKQVEALAAKSSAGSGVVQRVVVVPRLELDEGLIMDIWQILRNGRDSGVTLLELLNLENHNGEALNMMGHGPVYAEMAAADLAVRFVAAGLQPNMAVINLLSCNSGEGGEGSYAALLSAGLGRMVTVTAYRGSGITMPNGISHSTREGTAEEQATYEGIIAGGEAQLAVAHEIAERVIEDLAGAQTQQEVTAIIMAAGEEINAIAGEVFNQLYEFQQGMIVGPEEGVFEIPAVVPNIEENVA